MTKAATRLRAAIRRRREEGTHHRNLATDIPRKGGHRPAGTRAQLRNGREAIPSSLRKAHLAAIHLSLDKAGLGATLLSPEQEAMHLRAETHIPLNKEDLHQAVTTVPGPSDSVLREAIPLNKDRVRLAGAILRSSPRDTAPAPHISGLPHRLVATLRSPHTVLLLAAATLPSQVKARTVVTSLRLVKAAPLLAAATLPSSSPAIRQ
jgi:hypothetical protein